MLLTTDPVEAIVIDATGAEAAVLADERDKRLGERIANEVARRFK